MFKSALLCFLLAGAFMVEAKEASKTPRGIVDGVINGILAPILEEINGIKYPIKIDHWSQKIPDSSIVQGQLAMSNAIFDMKDFLINITALDEQVLTIVWTSGFTSQDLSLDFDNDIRVLYTQLGGKGSIDISVSNLHFDGSFTASINSLSPLDIKVTAINSKLSLDDAKFAFTGLLGDDELSQVIGDFLTEYTTKFVNKHAERICVVLNAIIKLAVDTITI